jgi:hypothetical protein
MTKSGEIMKRRNTRDKHDVRIRPAAVRFFVDGGFLVRGTLDPGAALLTAVDGSEPDQFGYVFEMGVRPGEDGSPTVDEASRLGDLLHGYLSDAKPGLYRFVPASPGDPDYGWFVWPAKERGRGVFEAVLFPGNP